MKIFKLIFALLILFTVSLTTVQAQILEVVVKSDFSQIAQEYRDKLGSFNEQVARYVNQNQTQFISNSQNSKLKIKCELNFIFNSASGIDNYGAQIIVVSQRQICPDRNCVFGEEKYTVALRVADERCAFNYSSSMPMIKNDSRFDPLLSLVDYYIYMVLGYDEDSFIPKGGNRYFQKALDICSRTNAGAKGWTETGGGAKPSRLQFVQEMLNTRFDNFRKGYFEYMWMGMDSLNIEPRNAQQNIINALDKIAAVKKGEVKAYNIDIFFEVKSPEIADAFVTYPDKSIYDKLIQMDPTHRSIYDEARKRIR